MSEGDEGDEGDEEDEEDEEDEGVFSPLFTFSCLKGLILSGYVALVLCVALGVLHTHHHRGI
ncbi:hypothetical protein NSMS1_46250 [Nostoc sp. MS1]|nr:hypothetical protein NSMS1_46250 [Nostoc sp. MS1]